MSTQLKINEDLIQYLQKVGYRKDSLVDELEKETKALGKVAQMQIAKEQGQFLEIIINMASLIHQFRFGTTEKDLGRKFGVICNLPGVLKV